MGGKEEWRRIYILSLREIGELFGGAQYTAVAQMIGRTRIKDRAKQLRFSLDKLLGECQK